MKKQIIMTPEKLQLLKQTASPYKSVSDLAHELNVTIPTIRHWIYKLKLPVKRESRLPLPQKEVDRIKRLANPNLTVKQLCEKLGIPYSTMHGWLVRLKLPFKREKATKAGRQLILDLTKKGKDIEEIRKLSGLRTTNQIYVIIQKETGMSFKEYRDYQQEHINGFTPCMRSREKWPLCREKKCYLAYKCESFQEALRQGKVDRVRTNDTHSSGHRHFGGIHLELS